MVEQCKIRWTGTRRHFLPCVWARGPQGEGLTEDLGNADQPAHLAMLPDGRVVLACVDGVYKDTDDLFSEVSWTFGHPYAEVLPSGEVC